MWHYEAFAEFRWCTVVIVTTAPLSKTTLEKLCHHCLHLVELSKNKYKAGAEWEMWCKVESREEKPGCVSAICWFRICSLTSPKGRTGRAEGQWSTVLSLPLASDSFRFLYIQTCTHFPPITQKQSAIKWQGSILSKEVAGCIFKQSFPPRPRPTPSPRRFPCHHIPSLKSSDCSIWMRSTPAQERRENSLYKPWKPTNPSSGTMDKANMLWVFIS